MNHLYESFSVWQLQNYRTRKETKQLNGYFFKKLGLLVGLGLPQGQDFGLLLQRVWFGQQRMVRTVYHPFEVHLREELHPKIFDYKIYGFYLWFLPLRHISHSCLSSTPVSMAKLFRYLHALPSKHHNNLLNSKVAC